MFLLEHQNSYEHFRTQSVLLPSSLAHCFLTLPPQAFVHLLLYFRLLLPQSTALQEPCPWDSVVTWNTLREATLEQTCYLGGSCLSCQCCKKSLFTWTWAVIMLDWNWWPVSQNNTKYNKNWHWLYWSTTWMTAKWQECKTTSEHSIIYSQEEKRFLETLFPLFLRLFPSQCY